MTDDFDHANFGNKRLDARALKIAQALACKPEQTLPEVFDHDQELENAYDFFGHDWLSFDHLTQPHFEGTARRAALIEGDLSVLHDTTKYNFLIHHDLRENLSRFSKTRQGFFGHGSLVVATADVPAPLGYIAYQPFVHINDIPDASTRAFWEKLDGVMDNESVRWMRGVEQAAERLGDKQRLVHVFDIEGDSYEILHQLKEGSHRYVYRLGQKRLVSTPEEAGLLKKVMFKAEVLTTYQVWVSERKPANPRTLPKSRKPERRPRFATMEVRACKVAFIRPDKVPKSAPATIKVNVVYVREAAPPEGEEPVEWCLATSEAIQTPEDVHRVIERYKERWLIEESNKSIKTGCGYSKRQLRSATSLLNLLALTLPVSLDLLRFRYLSRAVPDWPATAVVTARQLQILQAVVKKVKWSKEPTVHEATYAVAKLGGFLKHNKVPGWQTISRGYQTLLEYEIGWVAGQRTTKPPD